MGYSYVVYVDGDAILASETIEIPFTKSEIVFGNEFNKRYLSHSNVKSPINSGFIVIQNTKLSRSFIEDIINSNECTVCRRYRCGINGFRDQGCIDKLFRHNKYKREIRNNNIGYVVIQSDAHNPEQYLLLHVAGSSNYDKLLKVIDNYPI